MKETLAKDALRLRRAGRLDEAAAIYQQVLQSEPANFEALHALGIVRYQRGQLEEAERLIGKAVSVRPTAADANYNRACLLQKLNRSEEALSSFDRAIALKPDYVEALVNRGSLLSRIERHAEALATFDRVLALNANIAEAWLNRATSLLVLGRVDEAVVSADRALALNPSFAEAWKIRGRALLVSQRPEEALAAFEKATQFAAKDADGWHLRAGVLQQLRRLPEALPCFDKAIGLAPNNLGARLDLANLYFETERFMEAAVEYNTVLTGDPACPSYVRGYLTMCRLHNCDWSTLNEELPKIVAQVNEGLFVLDPLGYSGLPTSAQDQLNCARIWTAQKFPPVGPLHWLGSMTSHERIRLAYISGEFRTHAVMFLVAGVFEHHDRTRFETTAFSFAADDRSAMRTRLQSAFDRFIDIRGMDDAEVAEMIRSMEIDIAIDLTGYTGVSRTGILARRPAPVQVNYLGFPATMGADYIDYIIGDRVVIPPDVWPCFSEKIVWLPDCYQANDTKRRMAERVPKRVDEGLPQNGFVFCCFNNNHKILPRMFDIWMRLLKAIEGSVLWLLQDNVAVKANLRREAQTRGVDADRLVFASRVSPPDHLARQALADLFLDTLPYNAHTTGSDALWAGLPIVTTPGPAFAGRVGASLLTAVGLPELIAPSLDAYEALALKLARDPSALAGIRAKLARSRNAAPLFDTVRTTRALEAAYARMVERHRARAEPASFAVDLP